MSANVGGAIPPFVLGLLTNGGNWTGPFMISVAVPVVGAVGWAILVDPERPIA